MSRIVWDKVGERFYETGVDRGVLYLYRNGKFTNGVAWNGLTAVNESPSGAEPSPLYADNIKYLNLMSAEEYAATIEAYTLPDEFDECDGTASIAAGVTIGQQSRKIFGFSYRTLIGNDTEGTDYGYVIHLVYNCLASPSARDHATVNDSPEAAQLSYEISTTPITVSGYKPTAHLKIDSTKIPAAKLSLLEDKLYGTSNAVPEMPTPEEVIEIVGGGSSETTGITINPVSATLEIGESIVLSAVTVPVGAEITWTTADSTKVTVSERGVITGVAASSGAVNITGTITVDGTDYTDTCAVTVAAAS